jgi:hypothetical protein
MGCLSCQSPIQHRPLKDKMIELSIIHREAEGSCAAGVSSFSSVLSRAYSELSQWSTLKVDINLKPSGSQSANDLIATTDDRIVVLLSFFSLSDHNLFRA